MSLSQFQFATARQITFGEGVSEQLPRISKTYGKNILLVFRRDEKLSTLVKTALEAEGMMVSVFQVTAEPEINTIEQAVTRGRSIDADLVIGFGGGSVIDTAKAAAALLSNPGKLLDYLEVVGEGRPLVNSPLPCIAVPTTAGTGSEVTRNAVISVPHSRVKVSLRSAAMLPKVALVDPALTYSLSPTDTAGTGLDTLTQLIEPFLSPQANWMTDGFCREGMRRVGLALPQAYRNGKDRDARIGMAFASLMGGLALANAKLGAVHGIAGPFGGLFSAPHGAVCGRLLPEVLRVNRYALTQRAPDHPALTRLREAACLLTGSPVARADDLITWIEQLVDNMEVPGLKSYGMSPAEMDLLAEKARQSSSMKGNPIELTDLELIEILERAMS